MRLRGMMWVVWLGLAAPAFGNEPLPPVSERFLPATVEETPSFQRHILPLMGKLGCNGRSCHGSFQGQGGFRLSLFGYDFKADHAALLEGDTPRIDLADPEISLAIDKPTLGVPHKGGRRMDVDSWEYRLFLRWIQAGAKPVEDSDPRFERLEVTPTQVVFTKPGETAQLKVIAHWTTGISEDVTPLCRYQTNNESVSEISPSGLITALGGGDTHVVVFYDNGVFPVETLLPVTDKVGPNYPDVPTPTRIDELVVEKLRRLGVVPSDLAGDAEFLRRVSLDMTGTLPAPAEIEAFLADTASDKRAKKIDELLERPTFAAWWATRLCDVTGNNPGQLAERYAQGQQARQWYEWIYTRLRENRPYDEIVAGILLAKSRSEGQDYDSYIAEMGSYVREENPADFAARDNMPHFWTRRTLRANPEKAMAVAYSFLGVRLQCAQCHKHPFDQWTQDDFNEFSNFFARVSYGTAADAKPEYNTLRKSIGKDNKELRRLAASGEPYPWQEVFVTPPPKAPREGNKNKRAKAKQKEKKQPRATIAMTAKLLGDEEIDITKIDDPREPLLQWMRKKDNPYFAKSFVNRVWADYFGVGIIEPADDLNLANPPSNAALLDYLADGFIEHKFDIRWLHREIANSRTYQLSWQSNPTNRLDTRNFSHAQPRRLPAEVAFDAVRFATASQEQWDEDNLDPTARRAIAQAKVGGRQRGNNNYALTVFGKPDRLTNCDCERSNEASLLQTIYLRNDQELIGQIEKSGWMREIDRTFKPRKSAPPVDNPMELATPLIREAFLRTVSRPPTDEELERTREHVQSADSPTAAMRDLVWALLNTKEFIVNH